VVGVGEPLTAPVQILVSSPLFQCVVGRMVAFRWQEVLSVFSLHACLRLRVFLLEKRGGIVWQGTSKRKGAGKRIVPKRRRSLDEIAAEGRGLILSAVSV